MAAVVDKIIDGSGLERTQGKWAKTRIAYVTGITGSDDYEIEYNGITAAGMPAYGAALGASPPASTMYLVAQSFKRDTATQGRCTLRYESPSPGSTPTTPNPATPIVYEFGTLTTQEVLAETTAHAALTVTYNTEVKPVDVVVDLATDTIRIVQVETLTFPGDKARLVRNKVNNDTWNGDAAGRWRCTNVQGRKITGGTNQWEMTYEILYSEYGHQPRAYYHNADNLIPADVVRLTGFAAATGNGSICVARYGNIAFNTYWP